jgi:pimeloyl-ACP methyl ester carboxylesterase
MTGDTALTHAIGQVRVPTLVITGEPTLDHVVPVSERAEHLHLWPHAESVTLARTGYLDYVTRPDALSDHVVRFIQRAAPGKAASIPRRQVG